MIGMEMRDDETRHRLAVKPGLEYLAPERLYLVGGNAGHGMLFRRHAGDLAGGETADPDPGPDAGPDTLVLHRGMNSARVRAEIHAVGLTPDGVVLRERLA